MGYVTWGASLPKESSSNLLTTHRHQELRSSWAVGLGRSGGRRHWAFQIVGWRCLQMRPVLRAYVVYNMPTNPSMCHTSVMIAVTVVHSSISSDRPPVLLVHGAANSSMVWRFWQESLSRRGWTSHAVDLRGHGKSPGSVDGVSMSDYADDVESIANSFSEMPVVIGWSMGGLVAIMFAARGLARACVGLAPSTPTVERDDSVQIRSGVFGPEEYGITSQDPAKQPAMSDLDIEERLIALESASPESRTARDDRKAGIVVTSLPCPLLVVTGSEDQSWPRSAYVGMHLPAEYLELRGSSHWGLVLNRRLLPGLSNRVVDWIDTNTT